MRTATTCRGGQTQWTKGGLGEAAWDPEWVEIRSGWSGLHVQLAPQFSVHAEHDLNQCPSCSWARSPKSFGRLAALAGSIKSILAALLVLGC